MLKPFIQAFYYLSIDIIIGAVVLLHFFSKQFEVEISWQVYVLLALVVWLIYTFDHLRDAKKAPKTSRQRYLFHTQHERPIVIAMGIVAIVALAGVFFLPLKLIIGGLILSLFCVFYVFFQKKLALAGWKEGYIALIYSGGIFLAPTVYSGKFEVIPFLLLFSLSGINLLIFSLLEVEEDETDRFSSIAIVLGKRKTERLIFSVFSIGMSVAILTVYNSPLVSVFFTISFLLYGVILLFPRWAKKSNRYRAIGDGVFMLPLFLEFM